jgi:hypothetical protein
MVLESFLEQLAPLSLFTASGSSTIIRYSIRFGLFSSGIGVVGVCGQEIKILLFSFVSDMLRICRAGKMFIG